MKNLLASLVALLVAGSACAISWEEIVSRQDIYITGVGSAETEDEADKYALADLLSQISLSVSTDMELSEDEQVSGGISDTKSYFQQKIKTFTQATLSNTGKMVLKQEPDAKVGRYIERSEINKIFEQRKKKILELYGEGQRAEQNLHFDDAFRRYYWALSLLKTMQHPAETEATDLDGKKHTLITYLPEHLNDLMKGIRLEVTDINDGIVDLKLSYHGKPVSSIDYSYNDGRSWSLLTSARDGRGEIELYANAMIDIVKVRFEYMYRSQKHIDPEVQQVLEVVKGKTVKSAYYDLSLKQAKAQLAEQKQQATMPKPNDVETAPQPQPQPQTSPAQTIAGQADNGSDGTSALSTNINTGFAKNEKEAIQKIVKTVAYTNDTTIKRYFTDEGWDIYTRLIRYGKARVISSDDVKYEKVGNEIVARSIPMSFSFKSGVRKSFVENVVFTFNEQSLIDNVTFGLGETTTKDIMHHSRWPLLARQQIIMFLENYQTAYALKRLEYIESIFSDDAIIIIGKVVRKLEKDGDGQYVNNKYVKRTQKTKKEYISDLRHCFRQQEFVNIRFSDIEVQSAGCKDCKNLYGIQVKQDYYSSTYGDTGFLFLLADLTDKDRPIIRVRTWQEEPDPELNRYYSIEDF